MSDELLTAMQLDARPELAPELDLLDPGQAAGSLAAVGSVPAVDDLDVGPRTLEEQLPPW